LYPMAAKASRTPAVKAQRKLPPSRTKVSYVLLLGTLYNTLDVLGSYNHAIAGFESPDLRLHPLISPHEIAPYAACCPEHCLGLLVGHDQSAHCSN
jgi:hypothetical protein